MQDGWEAAMQKLAKVYGEAAEAINNALWAVAHALWGRSTNPSIEHGQQLDCGSRVLIAGSSIPGCSGSPAGAQSAGTFFKSSFNHGVGTVSFLGSKAQG